jgi:hypothetical protein
MTTSPFASQMPHRPTSGQRSPLQQFSTPTSAINIIAPGAMLATNNTFAFTTDESYNMIRAPHQNGFPPSSQMPSGDSGFNAQDAWGFGRNSNSSQWAPTYLQTHQLPPLPQNTVANNHHEQFGIPLSTSSQPPHHGYITATSQDLAPMMYTDAMGMPQQQSHYLPQSGHYSPAPRPSPRQFHATSLVASPRLNNIMSSIEGLHAGLTTTIDGRPALTATSPTSAMPPAVGRQGTRGILPSAPGKEEPSIETEIEPTQNPVTKKWQCPACDATFSFPKHVKRHYMRRTLIHDSYSYCFHILTYI